MKKKLMVLALAALLLCGCLTVGVLAADDVIILNAENDYKLDVKIHLKGDINGDAKIMINEVNAAYAHFRKTASLTGYSLDCCDLNGDGRIMINEVNAMYAHFRKTNPLW